MNLIGVSQSVYPESKGCQKTPSLVLDKVPGQLLDLSGDFFKDYEIIVRKAKDLGDFTAIGGDQSISYPLIKGFAQGKVNPGVILFDAHADCNPKYKTPLYNDLIIALVENGIIKPSNILVFGLRSTTNQEENYLKMNRIRTYRMKHIIHESLANVCDALMGRAKQFSDLYISIDMDVVDPAFAPGVSVPEPAGLSSTELLYVLQRLKFLKNWRAADVVEINPDHDVRGLTVALGVKIVEELR